MVPTPASPTVVSSFGMVLDGTILLIRRTIGESVSSIGIQFCDNLLVGIDILSIESGILDYLVIQIGC